MQRTVHQVGERGLIARLRRRIRQISSVDVGLGDDAAVLRVPRGQQLLFTSDMIVEGVDFHRRHVPATQIGWKALACNVSDIAAMGGRPLWAVVSLGLPPKTPVPFVDGLYAGLERCARRFEMAIVGGDMSRAPCVVIDVALIGVVSRTHLTRRRGAQVGDVLFVTGRLGGSYPSGRHARFFPRVREAQTLVRHLRVHAMMDLSDGLASDLWQMSRASHVQLRIDASRIPVSRAGKTVEHALMDGEDFELLFAVNRRDAKRVPRRIGTTPVTPIGTVTGRGVGVQIEHSNGHIQPLMPQGFQHF